MHAWYKHYLLRELKMHFTKPLDLQTLHFGYGGEMIKFRFCHHTCVMELCFVTVFFWHLCTKGLWTKSKFWDISITIVLLFLLFSRRLKFCYPRWISSEWFGIGVIIIICLGKPIAFELNAFLTFEINLIIIVGPSCAYRMKAAGESDNPEGSFMPKHRY